MSLYSGYIAEHGAGPKMSEHDQQRKRHRTLIAVLVVLGLVLILSALITSTSEQIVPISDGQGGYTYVPVYTTDHPYIFMWIPGAIVLGLAILIAVVGGGKREVKGTKAHVRPSGPIPLAGTGPIDVPVDPHARTW